MRFFILFLLLLSSCGGIDSIIEPGRGVDQESGPKALVYPAKESAREARHGLWRGERDGNRIWEVRYTRGIPTGAYRQWNDEGELIVTWPFNWQGEIEGWARWFEQGVAVEKIQITPENQPPFDPIGAEEQLKAWAEETGDLQK